MKGAANAVTTQTLHHSIMIPPLPKGPAGVTQGERSQYCVVLSLMDWCSDSWACTGMVVSATKQYHNHCFDNTSHSNTDLHYSCSDCFDTKFLQVSPKFQHSLSDCFDSPSFNHHRCLFRQCKFQVISLTCGSLFACKGNGMPRQHILVVLTCIMFQIIVATFWLVYSWYML